MINSKNNDDEFDDEFDDEYDDEYDDEFDDEFDIDTYETASKLYSLLFNITEQLYEIFKFKNELELKGKMDTKKYLDACKKYNELICIENELYNKICTDSNIFYLILNNVIGFQLNHWHRNKFSPKWNFYGAINEYETIMIENQDLRIYNYLSEDLLKNNESILEEIEIHDYSIFYDCLRNDFLVFLINEINIKIKTIDEVPSNKKNLILLKHSILFNNKQIENDLLENGKIKNDYFNELYNHIQDHLLYDEETLKLKIAAEMYQQFQMQLFVQTTYIKDDYNAQYFYEKWLEFILLNYSFEQLEELEKGNNIDIEEKKQLAKKTFQKVKKFKK
ncbi:MAG: hypothetical protein ACK5HP_03210 [Bacilli bacterium]